jgi:glyoxylase-like metal-dependent hydrolase (beta-lactamase superfamily II)
MTFAGPIKPLALAVTLAMLPLVAGAADDGEALLRRAERAMGGVDVKTLRFAGSGTGATFGQAFKPGMAWPKLTYSSFARVADYENAALREDFARSRAEPTGGGAVPLQGTGEQKASAFLRDTDAWNQVGPTAFAPAGVAVDGRIHDLWTTPHGVLKAALKNKATVSFRTEGGKSLAAVSFTEPGRFSATALINADGLVERVESKMPHPVTGDTATITTYSDYRDYNGVKFPTRMRQTQGGYPVLDIEIKEVAVNQPAGIQTPDNVRNAVERVAVEKVAEGVWFFGGGSHNSVAIEMKDHMVLVETPLYDGRSSAVLAEVKKLAPAKPLRYVINSHHHFDHAGGLRTAVAEGATLVVSADAKPYYERIFANPNRISPDNMAKSGKKAKIIAFGTGKQAKKVFSDGSREVEIHSIADSVHAEGFNLIYLPKEKLLIEADAYTPLPPNAPAPNPVNGNNLNLAQNVERLKLDVERILPLHGRVVPMAELDRTIGRK